ncbi:MAG TPA: S9 family peptidase [Anaerolineales bacterium]|nr:S9 family peptidase [Anaerolineales bacterium]
MSFPIAPKRPKEITQHGQTRVDNYFWMRYREDPEVLKYLHTEQDYLEEVMQHTRPLQEQLFQEMKGRIKEDDSSAPEMDGDYLYYTRFEAGKQYPFYCRKKSGLDAAEEILLDQNALAGDRNFCRIGSFTVSPDATTLAYSVDADGTEVCTIYVKDLTTGMLLPDQITNAFGNVYSHTGIEWACDNLSFFYVTRDAALRPYRIYRHVLNTDPAQDTLLYEEKDETYFLWLTQSRSKAYILAYLHSTVTDEWIYLPNDGSTYEFKAFQPRRTGVEYQVEHAGDHFFVITNENAQNFKLMRTPRDATTSENWEEVLPHRLDTLLTGMDAFQDFFVLYERNGGFPQIRVSGTDGLSDAWNIPFPEPVYSFLPARNPEYKTGKLRFTYTSLVTPKSVIDYNVKEKTWTVVKQDEIPSGYDASQYLSERTYATAPDGIRIPMSLVYKKGMEKNGSNPTLLYGYGSYGYSIDAGFDPNLMSLLDRGFVFAIGHIRGGSEMGRAWYENGKMLNKKNTFNDFIACAEHLIAEKFTRKDKLAIMGGSAGGLLVGACVTMRPDIFGAAVAKVPFVDVVNTMSDPSIPLTTLEYDQWGNPDDRDYFDYILSYSPYENIRATAYPHLLITTGLNDPRVAFWEPAKFTAKLRELKTNDATLLLRTNFEAGHAGASGRYDFLKEIAFEYAFLIDKVGMQANT